MSGLRTSPYQFEVLVTYMEEHGDISRPPVSTKNKIEILRKWEELTDMLNSDVTSSAKTESKWKKVWTDLKNNTKKKLSRMEQDIETKGRTHAKFSDLELRVLDICGIKVESVDTSNIVEMDEAESNDDDWTVTERKTKRDSDPHKIAMKRKMSQQSVPETENDHNEKTDHTDHTYPSAKKRLDLESVPDLAWRRFLAQKHTDDLDMQREKNRIKMMEIQTQKGWQDIANRALDMFDRLVDKYCSDN